MAGHTCVFTGINMLLTAGINAPGCGQMAFLGNGTVFEPFYPNQKL